MVSQLPVSASPARRSYGPLASHHHPRESGSMRRPIEQDESRSDLTCLFKTTPKFSSLAIRRFWNKTERLCPDRSATSIKEISPLSDKVSPFCRAAKFV